MSVQGSPEWHAERLGCATASVAHQMLARTKSGWAASRENLEWELALQRITGKPTSDYSNAYMERGQELEADARRAFEAATGLLMEEVGFIKHPTIAWCGASPDGRYGNEGMEAKCRMPKGHGRVLLNGALKEAQKQIDFQMMVCDFEAVWFVSYCPEFPPELQLYYERIPRDQPRIDEMQVETIKFLTEVEATTERLRNAMRDRKEKMAA